MNLGEKKTINFFLGIAPSIDEIRKIIEKYLAADADQRLVELAYSRSIVENRFMNYRRGEILKYNKIYSQVTNADAKTCAKIVQEANEKNTLCQKNLWKFGISGDVPIILMSTKTPNDVYAIYDYVDAILYFLQKNLRIDLVILDEEQGSEHYAREKILQHINSKSANYVLRHQAAACIS